MADLTTPSQTMAVSKESPLSPLSPKHVQSTTKRALKAAQPLRDEVQAKVNKLQNRITEVGNVDGDVASAVEGLEEKRAQAHRHIQEEFAAQMKRLQEAMQARNDQLCEMATEHFRIMEERLKEKRDQLAQERHRIQACCTEGIEALELDDAWFIQAYPDINLEGGATVVTATRDMLQSKVGGWSVDFNPELRGNAKFDSQMVPAIKAHGQVQAGARDMSDAYFSPTPAVAGSEAYGSVSPNDAMLQREAIMSMADERLADIQGLSVDSIIEAQVQTMMKHVK
jgi:uncharacterized protein YoxC